MTDNTVSNRMRRQRGLRLTEGWQEVKVWVPTKMDADDVRELAAARRANAEALQGLSKEVGRVNDETEKRIARAIAEFGSAAYITPSGAVLDLMTQLSEEDDLESFSRAFVIIARAKPINAGFIENCVPAKIHNFFIKHRGVELKALLKWTSANPQWADELKAAVRNPVQFKKTVNAMAAEIKSGGKS